MLEVNFRKFQEILKKDALRNPNLHYIETSNSFVLLFKSWELWEYYTTVFKSDIVEFGRLVDIDAEQSIKDFKINYLSRAIELVNPEDVPEGLQVEPLTKLASDIIDPGKDITDEAEDYTSFFLGVVKQWEKKVVSALDDVPIEKSFEEVDKTFGEFLRTLFNTINSLAFRGKLKKYIKKSMVAGLESVEEELGVQIGFTALFSHRVKALEEQQLTGYTLPDGKKWHGIQGVTAELNQKILGQIRDDVVAKVGRKKMVENVQEIFKGSTVSQAERICRTETTRWINEAKVMGYQESGIKGRKAYSAVMDDRTSDLCRRLHKKYFEKGIPFDGEFVDDVTGQRFYIPPSHVNCRCVCEYRKI